MAHRSLFMPINAGALALEHRVVLAPMTRIRADEKTLAATDLTAEYYSQRATAGGLLISEAIHISPEATPIWHIYPQVRERGGHVPGLWTAEQSDSWKQVTASVHRRGARISCQLLHAGRVAQRDIADHPLVRPHDFPHPPVSSSPVSIAALDASGNHYNWDVESSPPRALQTDEIARLCRDYQQAAENALRAGFDCVELHAAHGYLIEQFMCDGVNQRRDKYGGSLANRCRLLFEIVQALLDVYGAGRVGVRLSPIRHEPETGKPNQIYFGVVCSDPDALYDYAVCGLNEFPLAYLLLTEPRCGSLALDPKNESAYTYPLCNARFRQLYRGTLMGAGGFTPQSAANAVSEGIYDLIAFGRWFLANPDLPQRIADGHPLNVYDRDRFYGGGAQGYTDYPRFDESPPCRIAQMAQADIGVSLAKKSN